MRYFNPRFWRDNYVNELDPSEKLLYIHTFTNPEARMCGISEVPLRIISSDTGFNADMLDKLFTRLAKDKKAFYFEGWLCTLNTIKHQTIKNGNIRKGIERELEEVPQRIINHFAELGTPEFREVLIEFGCDLSTEKKKSKSPTLSPLEVEIVTFPEWLNEEAWVEWFKYRKESKRKTITKPAMDKQWSLLKKYSKAEQQEIINSSIQNDYQGLFDLKSGGASNKKNFHVA